MNRRILYITLLLGTAVLGSLVIGPDFAHAYPENCPWCTNEDEVVGDSAPELHVSMRWCCINEAPACADPDLACEEDFQDMLWRRHERGSDCIWIPQCKINLRSGGTVSHDDYDGFDDLDTSSGDPGDVRFDTEELDDTWDMCDQQWGSNQKGMLAVSARRLIDGSGGEVRGVAVQGSIAQPYLMVADPTVLCQRNERTLAHEAGHVLNLGHESDADNLMRSGGNGAELTQAQCDDARDYVNDHSELDPPPGAGGSQGSFVDAVFDARNDIDPAASYADVRKVLVVDDSPDGGHVRFALASNGLFPAPGTFDVDYWFLLDTDNDPQTGGVPDDIVPGNPIAGVELVGQVRQTQGGETIATIYE